MNLKNEINYSIWCDFIEREFLENGFKTLIEESTIHGATSNPAIFQQSITNSSAYSQQMNMLQANDAKKIYEELAITDIRNAAKLLKPLYDENANDGFISLEVDPTLCNDTQATIEEGVRLHTQIGYDNVMIKIPATEAGYGAMKELCSLGISVNATLIFSPEQARLAAEALDEGIKKSGKDTKGVVSVFVSRFDRLLDEKLKAAEQPVAQIGIYNAALCYHEVEKVENFNVRTLFASTGVKGDSLKASYYIDELIYPNSINTAPLHTIEFWEEEGSKKPSEVLDEELCIKYFENLKNHNIDIQRAYKILLQDGLSAFKVSFQELLEKVKIEEK